MPRVMQDDTTRLRYSDADLEEFRGLITEKLERARGDLDFYRDSIVEMADDPDSKVKGLDDGSATAEVQRLQGLVNRTQRHIAHLENALQRIDAKNYGVCRQTGELIPKARLRAVPHATLSVEAKMSRN